MILTRCQDVVEVVTDHLEGVLTVEQDRALAAHLLECDGCTAYLQQVRSVVAALRRLGSTDPR